ncbi:MAG: nucleoside triphosphate pyrophosphohydrolase [Halioglobus sp.]
MSQGERTSQYSIDDLLRVMQRLRDPDHGCPWDLKQDFKTIVPSTLEECYELAHAIEQEDFHHVGEELGDVLFQVIFYAQLGSEQGMFDFQQVVDTLVEKLIRRHPHVFADGEIEGVKQDSVSVDEVNATWEAIKQQERSTREQHGVLADVPLALPALPRAQKLQKRAAGVGFDWHEVEAVFKKIDEELQELRVAIQANDSSAMKEEMGDVLFSCVNLSRHLKLDAETSLRESSSKFENRFRAMEVMAADGEKSLHELDDESLDTLWERAKRL